MHLPVRSLATLRCLRIALRKALSQSPFAKPVRKALQKAFGRATFTKQRSQSLSHRVAGVAPERRQSNVTGCAPS